MFGDYLLIVPLVLALGIGWWLGRRDWHKQRMNNFRDSLKDEYFDGLSHLVDNETDEAIDSFIKALQHNSETVPIRLALGTLFRRRGEVQRSIQLHQEVMAHPSLSSSEYLQAQLALSRDYLAAGLLDRAESLLLDVLEQAGPEFTDVTVELLIELYQQEKEWAKALDIAQRLRGSHNGVLPQLAHFHCEQAAEALRRQDCGAARQMLKQALRLDPGCVRASLLSAELEMADERWKAAIKHLKAVQDQDPAFISEAVPRLASCYRRLHANDEMISYLQSSMQVAPSTTSMLLIAEEIAEQQGDYSAGAYITEQLKRRPSVKGFNRLIDLHLQYSSDSAKESLKVLRGLTGQLEQSKPLYRCHNCGFSGQTLHWLCPGCKRWGQIKPIQGLEGE